MSTVKCPDFLDVLKEGNYFLSAVKGLLRATGVEISVHNI
jgi:hypothetical protein